jgi:hypothetical protein
MAVPLNDQVAEWLSSHGLRLEYAVHAAFRRAGLAAALSNYVESADGKFREIDVTAHSRGSNSLLKVMCECKYSKAKPWVLLHTGLVSDPVLDWFMTPKSKSLQKSDTETFAKSVKDSWHFSNKVRVSHTVVEAFKKDSDGRDFAFDSLQKISNAVWDWAECNEDSPDLIGIPCLVVDSPLFIASLDPESDKFIVDETPMGRISWSGCRKGTIVDVVQASALDAYAAKITATFKALHDVLG